MTSQGIKFRPHLFSLGGFLPKKFHTILICTSMVRSKTFSSDPIPVAGTLGIQIEFHCIIYISDEPLMIPSCIGIKDLMLVVNLIQRNYKPGQLKGCLE